jgi:hypothetical protein
MVLIRAWSKEIPCGRCTPGGGGALPQVTGLVDDQHRLWVAEIAGHVVAHVIAQGVGIPHRPSEQVLPSRPGWWCRRARQSSSSPCGAGRPAAPAPALGRAAAAPPDRTGPRCGPWCIALLGRLRVERRAARWLPSGIRRRPGGRRWALGGTVGCGRGWRLSEELSSVGVLVVEARSVCDLFVAVTTSLIVYPAGLCDDALAAGRGW